MSRCIGRLSRRCQGLNRFLNEIGLLTSRSVHPGRPGRASFTVTASGSLQPNRIRTCSVTRSWTSRRWRAIRRPCSNSGRYAKRSRPRRSSRLSRRGEAPYRIGLNDSSPLTIRTSEPTASSSGSQAALRCRGAVLHTFARQAKPGNVRRTRTKGESLRNRSWIRLEPITTRRRGSIDLPSRTSGGTNEMLGLIATTPLGARWKALSMA